MLLVLQLVILATAASVSAQAATPVTVTTITAGADTYVDSSRQGRAFGTGDQLKVRDVSPELRTYLRFDLTGVDGAVQRALLRVRSAYRDGRGFDVRAVSDTTWPESITYRTAPAVAPTTSARSGPLTADDWTTVDVTPLVEAGKAASLALTHTPPTTDPPGTIALHSRESGSYAPELIVESAAPDTTPDTTPPNTTITKGPASINRTGIASFTFAANEARARFECKLDTAPYRSCAADELLHVANGRHRLLVRAIDAAGNVDPTPVVRTWWADAILQNGTFEATSAGWAQYGFAVPGWKGYQSKVDIVDGGIVGKKARVTPLPGQTYYSIYDAPRSVDTTVAGRTYTARGQVRSDTPGARVCLDVVERSRTEVVAKATRCVTATTSWQPFPGVPHTAQGGNNLYVSVWQERASSGDSFELDAMEIVDGTRMRLPRRVPEGDDPQLLAFGDIAFCDSSGDEAVARLVDTLPGTIAMVGDTEQNRGSAAEFAGCFQPAWNRHLWRTRPAVGDHEYRQPGAAPYWRALGARAGVPGKGWYSYDLGSWHIIVLNSNCGEVGGCGPGSEQYAWLERDLAEHATSCIGAYFHHPRFSSGNVHGSIERVQPFWDVLYRYSAEWVLGGNDANYQRFAPQTPSGGLDTQRGLRQFVVGTGGTMHYGVGAPLPNTQVQHSGSFGALQLTLGDDAYSWNFLPQEGRSFTDSGSTACSPVPEPDRTPPTVRLTEPAQGATLGESAQLKAEASDDDAVDQVEFRAGNRILAIDTTAPYEADVDLTGLPAGAHRLTAVARDRSENAATSDPVDVTLVLPAPPPNLVANPGFEESLSGWSGYQATLSRVGGAAEGAYAARASFASSTSTISIVSTPVESTTAGTAYSATAWVRSERAGRRVCLRLREMTSTALLGGNQTCLNAVSGWQAFPVVRYTTVGGGRLDLYAHQEAPISGDSFDLDDVRLSSG